MKRVIVAAPIKDAAVLKVLLRVPILLELLGSLDNLVKAIEADAATKAAEYVFELGFAVPGRRWL